MTSEDLERRKLELEVQKIERELGKIQAEADGLRSNQSGRGHLLEWFKALAGLGAAVTAIVALFGFWFSVARWNDESAQQRANRQLEALAKAYENLSAESAARRLSGVALIRSQFPGKGPDQQIQILHVIVAALSIEKEAAVRDAMLSMLQSLDSATVPPAVLHAGLEAVVKANRSLALRGDLRQKRELHPAFPAKLDGTEALARSLGDASVILLRKGARTTDMAGVYCLQCDYSGLNLSRVDFSNAVLYLSNFENARLMSANFDGADLEGTSFINADLRAARLTDVEDRRPGFYRVSYVSAALQRGQNNSQIDITGPIFDCADLRDASFAGHPLFGFSSKQALIAFPPSFINANLTNTDFAAVRLYGARERNQGLPFAVGSGWENLERGWFEFGLAEEGFRMPDGRPSPAFSDALAALGRSFAGSNWRSARFSGDMRAWLEANPPRDKVLSGPGLPSQCVPRWQADGGKGDGGKGDGGKGDGGKADAVPRAAPAAARPPG